MKKIILLVFVSFSFKVAKTQTSLSYLLKNDSTLNSLKNGVDDIFKKYKVNKSNYQMELPDSLKNIVKVSLKNYKIRTRNIQIIFIKENVNNINLNISDSLLLKDSVYSELKAIESASELTYGNLTSNYPDSLQRFYTVLKRLIEKRGEIIKTQEELVWSNQEDSMIERKVFVFDGLPKLGFGAGQNQGFVTMQYAFVIGQYKNAYFGIGSGFEYVNRGSNLVSLFQAPVYVSNYLYLDRIIFLNFDYGLTIPLRASYKNIKDETIDYKNSDLKNNFYFDFGIGIQPSKVGLQLNIRNQSLGVPDELDQNVWMFGIKVNF